MGIMTREQFAVIVKGLKAVYSAPSFIPDKDAFDVWYQLLKDIPYSELSIATQTYMATQREVPTIADLRLEVVNIRTKAKNGGQSMLTESEAWGLVKKALSNSIYGYNEEYAKLPPVIQRAMVSARNLHDIASSDDVNMDVQESLFYRRYRSELTREFDEDVVPESIRVKNLISETIAKVQQRDTLIAEKPQEIQENTN